MKYIVRAIKYFFYFSILCTVLITALVLIGAVENDINAIFEEGYNSIWKIAIFFAAVAAVYPNVAFINRQVTVDGERNTVKEDIKRFLEDRHYDLESEDAEGMTFRIHGLAGKLSKMYEDRITIRWNADGFMMEGLRKDILRLAAGLETSFLN